MISCKSISFKLNNSLLEKEKTLPGLDRPIRIPANSFLSRSTVFSILLDHLVLSNWNGVSDALFDDDDDDDEDDLEFFFLE